MRQGKRRPLPWYRSHVFVGEVTIYLTHAKLSFAGNLRRDRVGSRRGAGARTLRGALCRGAVRHRPDRRVVLGCLRASADHGVRHLRSVRLGSGSFVQVERSAAVQEHFHVRDRILGRRRAGAEHRPHGRDADRPVRANGSPLETKSAPAQKSQYRISGN